MLKEIKGGPYYTYLPKEEEEAEKGGATLFRMRRVPSLEATEYDLIVERAEQRSAGMDVQSAAVVIHDAWRECLVRAAHSIEHGAGESPVSGAKEINEFALKYLDLRDMKYLVGSSKHPAILETIDAAIKEQRLKNASSSSPGSTHGEATATGEDSNTIADTVEDVDGKTKQDDSAS